VSDRALKRLVARLGAARQEDVEAVLARLDGGQRRRIRAMLRGEAPPAMPAAAAAPADPGEGLSPWLRDRVRAAAGTAPAGEKPPFAMTPMAARALAAAAAAPAARARPAPLPRPGRLEQMKGRLIRPRVPT
jgi:hypothetical protein